MRAAGATISSSLLGVDSVCDVGELCETDDSEEGSDDDKFAQLEYLSISGDKGSSTVAGSMGWLDDIAIGASNECLKRRAGGTSSDSEVGTGEGNERGEELQSVFEQSSGGKKGLSLSLLSCTGSGMPLRMAAGRLSMSGVSGECCTVAGSSKRLCDGVQGGWRHRLCTGSVTARGLADRDRLICSGEESDWDVRGCSGKNRQKPPCSGLQLCSL